MELFLSKLIPQLIYPVSLAFWLLLCGLFLLWFGRTRLAGVSFTFSVLVLWSASLPVLSGHLRGTLERQYPPVAVEESPRADAIVVLGGGIGAPIPPRLTIDLSSAADRVLHAARLFGAGKAPVVIVSGGGIPWVHAGESEAPHMAEFLQEWGVPLEAIVLEGESSNTYENALYTSNLLKAHGWDRVLLVTSALHMPRALATFEKAGANAIPSPTDLEVVDDEQRTVFDWLPNADALAGTTRTIKEYLGILVYRVRGWM